jgi:two-component system, chemotaxis family, sensor kinase CheA
MSVDDQTALLYVEEARECLRDFEHALLMLESLPDDPDLVARLFRSAHTLKGNSRIMGYDVIATFTHHLEDLLDLLRNGDLMITQAVADVLLAALDVLKELVGEVSGGEPHDPARYSEAQERVKALRTTLRLSMLPQRPSVKSLTQSAIDLSFTDGIDLDARALDEPQRVAEAVMAAAQASATAREPEPRELVCEVPEAAAQPPAPEPKREARSTPRDPESSSVRVPIDKLDRLINLTGEVVIAQSMIAQLVTDLTPERVALLQEVVAQMDRHCRELQERMLGARMLPVRNVFARFHRLVRDLSAATGKAITLELSGEDTELDKTVIEKIADPLTHLVRNAVDHGVETSQQRAESGKPAQAKVALRAYQKGGSIFIEVSDDGRGIDAAKVVKKAKEKGLVRADAQLSDEEAHQLIFQAGFSTADQVTELSGRGVGMDVVKRNVEALKGSISTESTPGKGTCFRLKLPLTLAILDGLGVRVGSDVFLVPLVSIIESLQPQAGTVSTLPGVGDVVDVRGEYLPLVRLHAAFGLTPQFQRAEHGIVMVLDDGTQKFALHVDELIGQYQVVIKSLETNFCAVPGVAGATVLGDGRVALILDVGQLTALSRNRGALEGPVSLSLPLLREEVA